MTHWHIDCSSAAKLWRFKRMTLFLAYVLYTLSIGAIAAFAAHVVLS